MITPRLRFSPSIAVGIALLAVIPLRAQCNLAIAESQADEALWGAYMIRATMNAPGADWVTYTAHAPNGNVYPNFVPCTDPTDCSALLPLDCINLS
ncbi:MAG TPA: hypothetical protein VH087_11235, partial [Thermoanaerobaculia bacterium]|nr:hypothetical protein [Thermoanaerobaculia bacterium]